MREGTLAVQQTTSQVFCFLITPGQAGQTSLSRSSLKNQNVGCIFHSSFSFQRENLHGLYFSQSWVLLACNRGWHSWNQKAFLTCFSAIVLRFEFIWGTATSNWFLEFSWRFFGLYIVKLVSLWGKKIWGFLFCYLGDHKIKCWYILPY